LSHTGCVPRYTMGKEVKDVEIAPTNYLDTDYETPEMRAYVHEISKKKHKKSK